jgi:hypothetical protein
MNAALEKILNFGELRESLMFANTPTYLYTRFHREPSVQYLARQHETSILLADLEELLHSPATTVDDLVKAYALCVSLSFKPCSELSRLKDFTSDKIEWFEVIKRLVFEDAPKTQRIAVNINKPINVSFQQNSGRQCAPLIASEFATK